MIEHPSILFPKCKNGKDWSMLSILVDCTVNRRVRKCMLIGCLVYRTKKYTNHVDMLWRSRSSLIFSWECAENERVCVGRIFHQISWCFIYLCLSFCKISIVIFKNLDKQRKMKINSYNFHRDMLSVIYMYALYVHAYGLRAYTHTAKLQRTNKVWPVAMWMCFYASMLLKHFLFQTSTVSILSTQAKSDVISAFDRIKSKQTKNSIQNKMYFCHAKWIHLLRSVMVNWCYSIVDSESRKLDCVVLSMAWTNIS